MDRLGVDPAETLVVEDNEHGVQSAEASGAHVLVVRSPMDVTYDRIVDRITAAEVESR
jgi:beta-phosphoglucomutase-like phosphatase (HAD superfamily)